MPASCSATFNGDCDVGPADLTQLLAEWGIGGRVKCDFDDSFVDGSRIGGDEIGFGAEQDWSEIQVTSELFDRLTTSPLHAIWDRLWNLLAELPVECSIGEAKARGGQRWPGREHGWGVLLEASPVAAIC